MKALAWKWSSMALLFFILSSASSFVRAKAPHPDNYLRGATAIQPTEKQQQLLKKLSGLQKLAQGIKQKLAKRNAGLIILVILGALLATVLLFFGAFILAYGGLPGLVVALVGIIGLGFIIWGAVSLIKNIRRKRSTGRIRSRWDISTAFTKTKVKTPSRTAF